MGKFRMLWVQREVGGWKIALTEVESGGGVGKISDPSRSCGTCGLIQRSQGIHDLIGKQ